MFNFFFYLLEDINIPNAYVSTKPCLRKHFHRLAPEANSAWQSMAGEVTVQLLCLTKLEPQVHT